MNEIEVDENGHDLQCSSGVGFPCDCFKENEKKEINELCQDCGWIDHSEDCPLYEVLKDKTKSL